MTCSIFTTKQYFLLCSYEEFFAINLTVTLAKKPLSMNSWFCNIHLAVTMHVLRGLIPFAQPNSDREASEKLQTLGSLSRLGQWRGTSHWTPFRYSFFHLGGCYCEALSKGWESIGLVLRMIIVQGGSKISQTAYKNVHLYYFQRRNSNYVFSISKL